MSVHPKRQNMEMPGTPSSQASLPLQHRDLGRASASALAPLAARLAAPVGQLCPAGSPLPLLVGAGVQTAYPQPKHCNRVDVG